MQRELETVEAQYVSIHSHIIWSDDVTCRPQEMQRELETVEAQYALDRRRKSSDDVISTPSSYRSRSSSIPSSEDVDEPKLFQVRGRCIESG